MILNADRMLGYCNRAREAKNSHADLPNSSKLAAAGFHHQGGSDAKECKAMQYPAIRCLAGACVAAVTFSGCGPSRPEALYDDRVQIAVHESVLAVGHHSKSQRPWLSTAVDAFEQKGFRAEWLADNHVICRRNDRYVEWEIILTVERKWGSRDKATAACQVRHWHAGRGFVSKNPPTYPPAAELVSLSEEYHRIFVDSCRPDLWDGITW